MTIGSAQTVFRAPRRRDLSLVCGLLATMVFMGAGAVPASARDEIPQDSLAWGESTAGNRSSETAATQGNTGRRQQDALPRVLSGSDEESYRAIFAAQDAEDWAGADRVLRRLEDRLLVGQVLAQRYLHQGAQHAKLDSLNEWLRDYPDYPEARDIHTLAKAVAGRGRSHAVVSLPAEESSAEEADDAMRWGDGISTSYRGLPKRQQVQIGRVKAKFRFALSKGATVTARKVLEGDAARGLLQRADLDGMRAQLALAYFRDGEDSLAEGMASQAARSRQPLAEWVLGLSNWRQGRMEKASQHFERLARSPTASRWMVSAGAYWAARCNLKARHPEAVNHWLEVSAQHSRTVYGMLARRALGLDVHLDWTAEGLGRDDAGLLTESTAGRRALALVQAGRDEMAERQLRKIYATASVTETRAVLSLAQRAGLSQFVTEIGNNDDREFRSASDRRSYPMPAWNPNGGWRLDRALVLAFVRQESGFNPGARSPSGARGLMQLMPATASALSRGTRRAGAKDLYQPAVNLMLGQRYLERLLEDDTINGNLMMMIAAYNVGPGAVQKWVARVDHRDDPLLFLEAMPSSNTRIFVERVMMNFWMYRMRLNQPMPELDALAAGDWPLYVQLDDHTRKVAENVPH
ncbi:MAG: lytic transglycosylase domain-containing protein [Alphaproteobacteria bacterium]